MRLMPKILCSPVLGRSNIGQFTPLLGNILTMLRVSDTDAQNQSPNSGLAQTACNSLKIFQTPNMAAAQNLRVCLMYAHRNSLNQLNYSDPRESANLMILLNSVESTESGKHEQYSGSPEHYRYSGSAEHNYCLGSAKEKDNAANAVLEMVPFLIHEENQQHPALGNGKRLSLIESVNYSSSRGAVHCLQLTQSQLQNSSGVVQTLHAEIKGTQKLQVTESHPQNNPGIIGEPPILEEPHSPDDIGSAQPFESVSAGFSQAERNKSCSLLPHRGMEVEQDLKIKTAIINTANAKTIFFIAYPFGSMPRDCSSFLRTRFIQVARDESPSFFISASSCIRSSCWSRIWYWSVFALSLDIVITKSMSSACGCNYNVTEMVLQLLNTAKPRSARTLSGPLTKPLTGVTKMAESQHTQSHPEFTWRFLALSAVDRNIIHITATTEREAREQSPAGCVMVFAGRLPAQGGCNA